VTCLSFLSFLSFLSRLLQVTPRSIEQFKRRWSELDLSGVGFIYVAEVWPLQLL
jgi:hypothetical protein